MAEMTHKEYAEKLTNAMDLSFRVFFEDQRETKDGKNGFFFEESAVRKLFEVTINRVLADFKDWPDSGMELAFPN